MRIIRQTGTGIEAFIKPAIGEEPGDPVANGATLDVMPPFAGG